MKASKLDSQPKKIFIIFGKGSAAAKLAAELRDSGDTVRTTPTIPQVWDGDDSALSSIVFIDRPEIGESWTLRRFCDGASLAFVLISKAADTAAAVSCSRFLTYQGIGVLVIREGDIAKHLAVSEAPVIEAALASIRVEEIRPGIREITIGQGQLPTSGGPFSAAETASAAKMAQLAKEPVGELCDPGVAGRFPNEYGGDEPSSCG